MEQSDLINFDWFLITSLKFLKKYFLLFTAVTILGLAAGYSYSSYKKDIFESTLIGHSGLLADDRIVELIEELGNELKHKEYKGLSSKLGMDENDLIKIKSIDVSKVESTVKSGGSDFADFSEGCVKVEIMVIDPSVIKTFQAGLEHYLMSTQMISKALSIRSKSLTKLIEEIDNDILKLKELQIALIDAVKSGNDMFYLAEKSTSYSDKIQLNKEKQLFIEELEFLSALTVIQPFNTPENPISKKLFHTVSIATIFLLIGISFAGWKEINRRLLS